jgi:hypothetical protein
MSFPAALTRDDMEALDTLDLLPLRQRVGATHGKPLGGGRPQTAGRAVAAGSLPHPAPRRRRADSGAQRPRFGRSAAPAAQAYGAAIAFGSPTVHTLTDRATGQVLAPLMFLRIAAPRAYRQDLVQLLARCSAQQARQASKATGSSCGRSSPWRA